SNALRDPTPPGTLVSGADHAAATVSSPAAPEGDAFWTPEDDEVVLSGLEAGKEANLQSGGGFKASHFSACCYLQLATALWYKVLAFADDSAVLLICLFTTA
ncbi:hypothetical protein OC844_007528, partial [Tilletia horrida]